MEKIRPKTRGELLEALKAGKICEVANTAVEFTNICLDGWLQFRGKYHTAPSGEGWTTYWPLHDKDREVPLLVHHMMTPKSIRTVYHDPVLNTIRVAEHIFTWDHFFEVNQLHRTEPAS